MFVYNFNEDEEPARCEKVADFYATMIFLGYTESEIAYIFNRTNEHQKIYARVRCRDDYKCQRCGKTQDEELVDIGWRLSIHHKDGDHDNDDLENMITYCCSCHSIIENKNRREKISTKQDQKDLEIVYELAEFYNSERI